MSLARYISLSFTHSLAHSLSLLGSTDRFHNHFSEVTASSAVVTQPLACSVSFTHTHTYTYTHTLPQQYYTTQNPVLKRQRAALTEQPQHVTDSALKGQHVYFWLGAQSIPLLQGAHMQPVAAEWKCNTEAYFKITPLTVIILNYFTFPLVGVGL